jgi:hypothetical protein
LSLKVLLVLLGALVAAAAAPAGMIVPEPADAVQPRWLVDGRHVEMSYAQAANGLVTAHQPYVAADDGGGFRPANSGDIVAHPDLAVSPDGAHRAWFGSDANLYLDGRALTTGRDGYVEGWQPIAWSPDGKWIAFTWGARRGSATSAEVDVIPAAGGARRRISTGTSVSWINARTLAVGLEGYATDILRVDVATRRVRRLVSGYYSPGGFDISPDGSQIAFTSYVGAAYDRGAVTYAAKTTGADADVRRLSPDTCTVKPTLYVLRGRCIDGSNNADHLVGSRYGDIIVAGPENDTIRAGDGNNNIQAQWGNDDIRSGNKADWIHAGAGNDTIRSGGGPDTINPGPGRDQVFAGSGDDNIVAKDGERDLIDCGPGNDTVRADHLDLLHNCEHVTYAPPNSEQGF